MKPGGYKGQATLVKRKASQDENGVWVPHGEPVDIRKQNNVVTYRKIDDELNDIWASTLNEIWIDEQKYEPDLSVIGYFGNDTVTRGADIPAVTRWVYTPAAGMDDGFWTVSMRFDPPPLTETRNIWTILLGLNASTVMDEDNILAYIGLSAVCPQEDDEILDIFYRITIDTTAPAGSFNGQFPFMSTFLTEEAWGGTVAPRNYPEGWVSVSSPKIDNATLNWPQWIQGEFLLTPLNLLKDVDYLSFTETDDLILSAAVGVIMHTIVYGQPSNYISGALKILRPGDTPIQNLFGKTSSSILPFLDAGASATGSGSVTLNGDAWTGDLNTQEKWQYRVDITASGAVGVGTYQFSRRRLAGGYLANNYGSRASGLYSMRTWSAFTNQKQAEAPFMLDDKIHGQGVTIFPSADNHQINFTAPGSSQEDWRFVAGLPYGYPEVIYYDDTGITIFRVDTDDIVEHIDSTTTPSLPVTDISQVAFESDGTIWVASRNNGLYRITRTRLTGVTAIDRMTGGGLTSVTDDTECIGVCIKRSNDDIWAMFDGGLAQSTDGGATWTVYNEGTATQFLLSGYTGVGEWSGFCGMWIDPGHVDDRLAFGTPDFVDAVGGAGNIGRNAWWSRANSNPTSDAVQTSNNTNADSTGYRAGSTRGVWFHEDGLLLVKTSFGSNSITEKIWGNTGAGVNSTANNPIVDDSLIIIPSAAGAELILGYDSNDRWVARTIVQLGVASSGLNLGPATNVAPMQGELMLDVINGSAIYAGNGMLVSNSIDDNGGGFFNTNTHMLISFGHFQEPLGGDLEHEIWEHYGWTGAAWVLDDAGTKTIAAGPTALIDGLTISFADGGGAPHFVSTEFYIAGVMDAVWKDDATSWDMDITFPWSQIETGTTFTPSTVPAADVGAVTNEAPSWWAKTGVVEIYQEGGSLSFDRTAGSASAEQKIVGDFRLDFGAQCTPDTTSTSAGIGVFLVTEANHLSTTTFISANAEHAVFIRRDVGAAALGADRWWMEVREANVSVHSEMMDDYDPRVDRFAIKRIGTAITYERNASVFYTSLNASSGDKVLKAAVVSAGGVLYDMLLDYTANERRAVLGNGTTSGKDNADFRITHVPLMNTQSVISLAGVPATLLIEQPFAAPSAGEVVVRRNGTLVFNSADATDAITGDWIVQLKNNLV